MDTIQVAIADSSYASALRELLIRNGAFKVLLLDRPDPDREGVMVLDSEHLDLLPCPVADPERIVLIARNDPQCLTRAWEAGVNSVVFDRDPLNTAVLAIMSARLRIHQPKRPGPVSSGSSAANHGIGGRFRQELEEKQEDRRG